MSDTHMMDAEGPRSLRRARALAAGFTGLALLWHGSALSAQSTIDFTVSGSSTVRGWSCSVPGTAQVTTGTAAAAPGFADGVQALTLTVMVEDFVCPEEEMRQHLLEAMRAQEFPRITFALGAYEVNNQGAVTTGSLTILDTTREVSFPLSLTPSGSGAQIEGELPLDMTEYDVEPPVVFLGLLRVRPQIRIEFSGIVSP